MKNLIKVLVVGLVLFTSCNKEEETTPQNTDVFLGTFESNGGCIPNRIWDITITEYQGVEVYEFRCETSTGFETRRYGVAKEDATYFDIVVTSSSTIYMSSDIPAFRCSTYLTKVN